MEYRNIIFIGFFLMLFAFNSKAQVTANFNFDKSEGCGSLAVSFTDQSTTSSGSIVDWKWDLGGVFSSKQNPGIIFVNPGQYTICLTVTTSSGATASICKENIIRIYENPTADFTVDNIAGCKPVTVNFTNTSVSPNGKITNLTWDVGGTANVQNTDDPTKIITTTYNTVGQYSSTLSIVDEKGCKHTLTKPNLVNVEELPKVNLDFTFLSSCDLPWRVRFQNLDYDPLAIYVWDFGNGQSHSGPVPPIVTYSESKQYTIKVFVVKGACSDTITFNGIINTNRVTDFELNTTNVCQGQSFELKDISNYQADSLIWDFGDGNFSSQNNPSHTYLNPGCYVIKLRKFIGSCIQEITKPCVNVYAKPVVNYEVINGFSCLIPAPIALNANSVIAGQYTWTVTGPNIDIEYIGPNHNFVVQDYGSLNVALSFVSEQGCKVKYENIKIDIAKFEASLPAFGPVGCIPFNAMLSDSVISNVPLKSWNWQIGNPVIFTSNNQNPIFAVSDTGTWDIKLIVENIYGCKDTIIRRDYIQGGTPPTVNFIATPIEDCLKVARNFTSLASSNADFWIWSQNGIFFSNEENPEFVFPNFGVFDIELIAFHNGCPNSFTIKDYITVLKPKSQFKVDYRCDDPNTIDIQNQTIGADSLYWVVTLSETVSDTIRDSLLTEYTFPTKGIYFLTHYAKNFETGCDHMVTDSIFIVNLSAEYSVDTIRGCAPLDVQISAVVEDAVLTEYLAGQYTISDPLNQNPIVTFTEGGLLLGPELVVTDRHGCKDTFQISVPVEVSKIEPQISGPNVLCAPGSEQFLDVSNMGLGTLVDRSWFFSFQDQQSKEENPIFNIVDNGAYYIDLFLEDSWGCTATVRKEVIAVPLIPAFSTDTLSCTDRGVRFRTENEATFLGGYFWDFGDGNTSTERNPLHFYQNEGVYDICLELTDIRGCSKSVCEENRVVIINPKADFNGNPTEAPCPPLLSNFFNLSKNANSFVWDFGDNTGFSYNRIPSHVYTQPGSFDVTLYAEMIPGCVDTMVKTDFIKLLGPKAEISFSISGNCVPLEVTLSAASDKLYEFIWDYGDGKINLVPGLTQLDTTTYSYEKPGRFIPKLLVSDDAGCSRTFTIDPIIVNEIDPNFVAQNDPYCGIPAIVKIDNLTTSSSPNVVYQWFIEGPKSFVINETSPEMVINDYGQYGMTLIASTINCIDTLYQKSVFEVAAIPVPLFDIDANILCQYNELTLINNSTLEYGNVINWDWDLDNNATSKEFQPKVEYNRSGDYLIKLQVTTDKGCIADFQKTFKILPNTLITLPEDKTICIGDSVNISASFESQNLDFTFFWAEDPTIKCLNCQVVNVKPDSTTIYYIETQATNGCTNIDSLTVTVIPIPGPQLQLSSDTIVCEGGSIDISILNFNPNYDYVWDKNDLGLNCYIDCQVVNASPADDTYYSVIVFNEYGCFKEDSILVAVEKNIPDFLIEARFICDGDSTKITISDNAKFPIWSRNQIVLCDNCDTLIVKPSLPGYYFVDVLSKIGCEYKDSIYVGIVSQNTISAGLDRIICKGEEVKLGGRAIGDVEWFSTAPINNQNSLNATSRPNNSTIFYLQATIDECVLLDSTLVTVIEKTDVVAVGDTICPNEVGILTASGTSEQYSWFEGKKKLNTGEIFELAAEKTKTFTVIGSKGICIPDTAEVTLYVHPKIQYQLDEGKYEIFINSKVNIKAKFDENAGYLYQWSPSFGLDCDNCPEPTVQNIEESSTYKVLVTDIYGCELEDQVFLRYSDECTGKGFYIPNIFTPYSRSGANSTFRVYAEDEAEFISISIFDRWGANLFYSKDINETWDGTYAGQKLTQAVYIYIIEARCIKTNEIFNFVGDVTIIE